MLPKPEEEERKQENEEANKYSPKSNIASNDF